MAVTAPPPPLQPQAQRRSLLGDLRALYRYRELLRNLVAKELKLKYRGATIGVLWSLLNPLLTILVYTVAFKYVLRIPLENYPLFLVVGLLHWNFFAASTLASADAILGNAHLLKQILFPRAILPLATVLFQLAQFLLAFVPFLLLYVPLGGHFWVGQLLYPPALLLQIAFTVGVALAVSVLTVFFRDLKHLVEVLLLLLFWLTPIIYNFTLIPGEARLFFRLNPMVSFVIVYQDLFYLGEWPSLGNWGLMLFWAGVSLGIGYTLFRRMEWRFPEET